MRPVVFLLTIVLLCGIGPAVTVAEDLEARAAVQLRQEGFLEWFEGDARWPAGWSLRGLWDQPVGMPPRYVVHHGFDLSPYVGYLCIALGRRVDDVVQSLDPKRDRKLPVLEIDTIQVDPRFAHVPGIVEQFDRHAHDEFGKESPGDDYCADEDLWAFGVSLDAYASDVALHMALVCEKDRRFWFRRNDGVRRPSWLGPFDLPEPVSIAAELLEPRPACPLTPFEAVRFSPRARRVGKVTRRRKIVLRQDPLARALPEFVDLVPEDFDFGPGVRVLDVLRAQPRKVKVRIEIDPDAEPGERPVFVRGFESLVPFEIRPRRKRRARR